MSLYNTVRLEQCPERKGMGAYDPVTDKHYDSPDFCQLNDKMCLLASGDECEIYQEYLKELAADNG